MACPSSGTWRIRAASSAAWSCTGPTTRSAHSRTRFWQGIRVGRWKWIEYASGERELYDVVNDKWELENRATDPKLSVLRTKLHRIFERLADCAGAECVVTGYGDYWDKPKRETRA